MKILILDDDDIIRESLNLIVSKALPKAEILLASNGLDALTLIRNNSIDLVLLDVELDAEKRKLGIDFGRLIKKISKKTNFIVVSAYDKYAIKSYEIHPYYYLLKPIDELELIRVLHEWMLMENSNGKNLEKTDISISIKKGVAIIPFDEIIYLEKEKRGSRIITKNKIYCSNESLDNILSKLDNRFFKTYQSYIVNMSKIRSMEILPNRSWEIEFRSIDDCILISRYKYKDFFEFFQEYRQKNKI